jgi:hypothetical protein
MRVMMAASWGRRDQLKSVIRDLEAECRRLFGG